MVQVRTERDVDEILEESFPASDPPSWNQGVVRPTPVAARLLTIDFSPLARGQVTLGRGMSSAAAAAGMALLVPFAILLIGLPLALSIRGLTEVIGWLIAVTR